MDEEGNIVQISEWRRCRPPLKRDVSRPFCPRRHRFNQALTVGLGGGGGQRGSGVGVIQTLPEMNL